MRLRKPVLALLLSLFFVGGMGVNSIQTQVASLSPPPVPYATVGIEVERHIFGQQADDSVQRWKAEVSRRFPNAYLVDCHGNDLNGRWTLMLHSGLLFVNAHDYMAKLRATVPKDKVIVLLACNPNGHKLGVPGVYHARDSVWFVPDKQANNTGRCAKDPGCVGNIFEFVED